jgi:hypothetical protein
VVVPREHAAGGHPVRHVSERPGVVTPEADRGRHRRVDDEVGVVPGQVVALRVGPAVAIPTVEREEDLAGSISGASRLRTR